MSEPSAPVKAIEVFFSYSHKDENLRDELSKHLALLKRQRIITAWHDRRIGAGKEWENEIDEHLCSSDIILLLISSDFLASDYCYDIEVMTAMKRHEEGEARVIPVILRPVDIKGALFGKLQALPRDARPVTDWPNRDEAFLNVAQGIRVAAEELAVGKIKRLFDSFDKVEKLKNWPNVVSLGERILNSIPDHLPEYQSVRVRTALAYVKRWSRCFDPRVQEILGRITIKTKRNESLSEICEQITADLNRAIELEPENGEFYYLRYSVTLKESDLERAKQLDPTIAENLRDHKYLGRDLLEHFNHAAESAIPPAFDWDKYLDPPEPVKIKERWRLKCLRD